MRIPSYIIDWFKHKAWHMHSYQKSMFKAFAAKQSTLLIVPTGGGKTLASFLPSLVDIQQHQPQGLHTLYISPLKALTHDIERNLMTPIAEMQLAIRVESRTGDTSSYRRQRQRIKPPNILLTTPESLFLMLSYVNAAEYFKQLKLVIIDELHSFAHTKRGDLTALGLARLKDYAPDVVFTGLSATIAEPETLAAWLAATHIIKAKPAKKPHLQLLTTAEPIPYGGHMTKYAVHEIYKKIIAANLSIVFVNTRAQAEFMFRQLWEINSQHLPIAIYHGSLNKEQRQKTEKLTVDGQLRALVATSALELGIDWGNIDCVIQVGAPKGVSRLLQRIGRSNHRFDESSDAVLVPSNCFEALECSAAIDAIAKGQLDGDEILSGSQDVVIQFIINCACSEPINAEHIYAIVKTAYPYRALTFATFERLLQFAINGGYVLEHYERYHRLQKNDDDLFTVITPRIARRHRQNIGTIIEAARLKVKRMHKRGGKILGEIEENFAQQLAPGDTFLFAGEILEFIQIRDMILEARRSKHKDPKIPSYDGGTMPLSTYLAEAVRLLINTPKRWKTLPSKVQDWLALQQRFSTLPPLEDILIETFPRKKNFYTIIYSFEGRRANQTLGILITRRMENLQLHPLSFAVTDYGLAISSMTRIEEPHIQQLLSPEILADELEEWLTVSPAIKRAFRHVAVIAGLTERQFAGQRKSMKQVTFSTDLIYDVLLKHEPNHILLAITRHDVERALLDIHRLIHMLKRFANKFIFINLLRPSPMSLPIMLSLKTEKLFGSAVEELLASVTIENVATKMIDEVRKSVSQ